MMEPMIQTAAVDRENQDRGVVIVRGSRRVLAVADGAGGMSGGSEAAELAAALVRLNAGRLADAEACEAILREMDEAIARHPVAGETTCALAIAEGDQVFGASVGDSGVWLIGDNDFLNLTENQARKPLLGSETARPVAFSRKTVPGERLLLATDGLLKYAPAERIAAICRQPSDQPAPNRLIDAVRYRSGRLPDDVTVIFAQL
jgi:serine/threonine protein phosphatase PrpC